MKTYVLTEAVFSARDRIRSGEIVTTVREGTYPDGSRAADIVTSDGRRVNEVSMQKLRTPPKPGKAVRHAVDYSPWEDAA